MIPPNVAPPKTVVVHYPGAEEKLRKQYVYQTYLSEEDLGRLKVVPGNRLLVKFQDEIVGEGQAILVEPMTLERVTPYDAMISGYENTEAMRKHLSATVLKGAKKPSAAEFYRVLFRWL
ncbi:MAG: hypothetical protein A3K68_01385 [Euryarchaeota archaeon RBG_16_68_13]|nr:MAG: hypothetical protein A3K68_01385 [Euryarchaeota archaeon RBG_16_68_13]